MNLDEASHRRNWLGKAGALLCLLMLLSVLDGLVARFREPFNVFKVLPGATLEINGPLAEEVGGVEYLTYESSSPELRLTFEAVHKGYFLGGDMWRGRLEVGPHIAPGEYRLTVAPRIKSGAKPLPPFRIQVFADRFSLQESSKSLIGRHLGLSPFLVAALFLPAIALIFGAVYFLSQRMETFQARAGRAEVYRVLKKEGGYEIRFALGTAHGVHPGDHLTLADEMGRVVATIEVKEAAPTAALADVGGDQEVRPGFIVSRSPG